MVEIQFRGKNIIPHHHPQEVIGLDQAVVVGQIVEVMGGVKAEIAEEIKGGETRKELKRKKMPRKEIKEMTVKRKRKPSRKILGVISTG